MAITDERIRNILDGQDVDELLRLIDDPRVSQDEHPRVVLAALSQLEALYYENLPELAVRVCVEAPEKTAWDARYFFLSSWLKREGYHYRLEVIKHVITRLRDRKGEQLVAAIRTAWVIGYRDDLLQSELEDIAGLQGEPNPNDKAQGYALAALSDMAYPKLEEIAQTLRDRLSRNGHLIEPDCQTARYVASPEMIPALCEAAASKPPKHSAVHALLRLPIRYPDKASEVWKAFESLDNNTRLLYMSSALDRIDIEEVGHYLLSEVLTAFQRLEQRNALIPMNQLLKANLPSHIHVFLKARNSLVAEHREWLKSPAVKPTGNTGRLNTSETLNKEAAWKVILRLGFREARTWLLDAMIDEVNFTLTDLGEIAGFLQVTEAVNPLARAVRDKATYIGIGIECLRCLGIIGTREALNAILESQVRIEHGGEREIPSDFVEALGSACMSLRSCEVVWNVLINADADKKVREACAYTINDLSTYIGAPLPSSQELIQFLRTEGTTLPGYGQLVLTLSRFRDDITVLSFLRELADSEYESPELTQALALTHLLRDFPARIEKMGFKHTDEGWIAPTNLSDGAAFALLHLYRADPSFEPAMIEVLDNGSYYPALQIVANLRNTDNVSSRVREALWNYILHENGPNSSNLYSLEAVAHTWPEKLMENSTIAEVSRWSTSARRAYLTVLRTILLEQGNASAIARIACQFLADGESSIRRDAGRLARDSDPATLQQTVDRFATRAEELDQAVFMLDAAFWLDTAWSVYEERGRSHREPLVRNLTKILSQELKEVLLAREYLPIVLESHDYLDTWCYGQAILELGNEETVDRLYAGLPTEVYRRAYLIWLAKELEKRLEKRRKDQSDRIGLPPPISHEQAVEVTIELKDERLGPFAGILQKNQTRRARRWLSGWSIRIDDEPNLALRLTSIDADDSIFIKTSDGHYGQVLPVRSEVSTGRNRTTAYVLLLGQGKLNTP